MMTGELGIEKIIDSAIPPFYASPEQNHVACLWEKSAQGDPFIHVMKSWVSKVQGSYESSLCCSRSSPAPRRLSCDQDLQYARANHNGGMEHYRDLIMNAIIIGHVSSNPRSKVAFSRNTLHGAHRVHA